MACILYMSILISSTKSTSQYMYYFKDPGDFLHFVRFKVILASGNNHLTLGEWGRENKNKQQSPSFP